LLRFGAALPRIRRAVLQALTRPGLTRTKAVAAVVRLIDSALLRPGHEEYATKAGGRGAATLQKSETIALSFPGKGGKEVNREFHNPLLARVLRKLGGQRVRRAGRFNKGEKAAS
jgi:DNA topoisomerase I